MSGSGCEKFLDVNKDVINPTDVTVNLLLPTTQTAMGVYLGHNVLGLSQYTSAIMQQIVNGRVGTYGLSGDTFNNSWQGLYISTLSNNEDIIQRGTTTGAWSYVGIAQIQKAYVFSQMVDMWGDIPYSEALQGSRAAAPKFDKDSEIYADLFRLIDEGITNLRRTDSSLNPSADDLIYGGNLTKWIRLANTLKLKLYNQVRLVQQVETPVRALITSPDLITAADDFEFRFSTSNSPENRHPGFQGDFAGGSRENNVNRFFYELMQGGTTNQDPRVPYYFFNQVTATTTLTPAPDVRAGAFVTVNFASTGPQANANTNTTRTLQGLYPIGGRYDDGQGFAGGVTGTSAKGNVPQRFITFFARKFTEAELQLMVLNNEAAASTAFADAVRASFNKVNNIIATTSPEAGVTNPAGQSYRVPEIPVATIDAYVTAALARFAAATTPEAKLNVIMTEKYIANYGTGTDVYTDYRRTGYPLIPYSDLPAYSNTNRTGAFPVRLTYRLNDLLTNKNAPAQPNVTTAKVFWDK
jgi:hypothetical protein